MPDETEILAALFAASLGLTEGSSPQGSAAAREDLWHGFLSRLAAATQAESALLRLGGPGRPVTGWQVGADWDGPAEAVVERMRSGRVYSQIDLPGAGPSGPPLRALRWRLGREARVLLALRRRGEDFRAVDGLQLSNLIPYLGVVLGGWRQLEEERARALLDGQIAAALGGGWILFAPSGQVSAMAEGLEARLQVLAGLGLRADGRLSLPEEAAQALRLALAAVAQQPGTVRQVVLSTEPRVELRLGLQTVGGELQLTGRLRHALSARALPPDRLARAFGLSRSEARLAACLCDGLSLAEAAQVLGWTLETARSTSKQIYARMEVSGQPGVLRRMLESGVWLD